jgi:hypothetical protein
MNHLLLLGAGFSRNWGGWLATEVNDHLFTSPQIIADGYLQDLLHRYAATGGFEAALGECQTNYLQNPAEYRNHLENLQSAIDTMFLDMEAGFASKLPLQFSQELKFSVSRFLARFDTIFTLNQDLLLERHYLQSDVQTATPRIWNGWASPGMRPQSDPSTTDCLRVRWILG